MKASFWDPNTPPIDAATTVQTTQTLLCCCRDIQATVNTTIMKLANDIAAKTIFNNFVAPKLFPWHLDTGDIQLARETRSGLVFNTYPTFWMKLFCVGGRDHAMRTPTQDALRSAFASQLCQTVPLAERIDVGLSTLLRLRRH